MSSILIQREPVSCCYFIIFGQGFGYFMCENLWVQLHVCTIHHVLHMSVPKPKDLQCVIGQRAGSPERLGTISCRRTKQKIQCVECTACGSCGGIFHPACQSVVSSHWESGKINLNWSKSQLCSYSRCQSRGKSYKTNTKLIMDLGNMATTKMCNILLISLRFCRQRHSGDGYLKYFVIYCQAFIIVVLYNNNNKHIMIKKKSVNFSVLGQIWEQ